MVLGQSSRKVSEMAVRHWAEKLIMKKHWREIMLVNDKWKGHCDQHMHLDRPTDSSEPAEEFSNAGGTESFLSQTIIFNVSSKKY